MPDVPITKWTSKKFVTFIIVFFSSLSLAFFRSEFVGDATALFNFWIFLVGMYLTGNVSEKWALKEKK